MTDGQVVYATQNPNVSSTELTYNNWGSGGGGEPNDGINENITENWGQLAQDGTWNLSLIHISEPTRPY